MAARQARDRAEIDDRATAARDHFRGIAYFAISIIEATLTRIALSHASDIDFDGVAARPGDADIVDENGRAAPGFRQCARRSLTRCEER